MIDNDMKRKIFNNIKIDYESSKVAKNRVDANVTKWIKEYNGDKYGNEVTNRSQIVTKDVKKTIKSMLPSMIEPFINSDSICKTKPKTVGKESFASYVSDVLNYQYNNEFDKINFIRTLSTVLPKEGTVIVRTGWDFDEDIKKKTIKGLDYESLLVLQKQGINEIENVVQNKDGTFDITLVKRELLYNRPTAVVCKGEFIYTDPTAEKFDDCKFVIHKFEKSLSDIRKEKNIYNLFTEDKVSSLTESSRFGDSALSAKRFEDSYGNGSDFSFGFANKKASMKVMVVEYWGEYDIDDDGINEQIVCSWIEGTDVMLRLDENPYPDKQIPFVSMPYDLEPFAVWGNAVADIVGDNQKIHTAIMRGFIDNMSLSNNGQKIIQKGAIDYVNLAKLKRGEKYIEVNNIDGIRDGSYNQIPSSSFQVYDMVTQENEMLTGVNRNIEGIDAATIGRTASGIQTVMGAAQRHLQILVYVIADLYKKVFTKWYKYNQAFLEEGQAVEISGQLASVVREQLEGSYNVEININLDSANQQKIQQINMMLQQAHQYGNQLPPMVVPLLVAEIFDGFGKNEQAEMIRQYKPEPDPMQQQMAMLEIEYKKAEIAKLNAEAGKKTSEIDNTDMDTLNKRAEMDVKQQTTKNLNVDYVTKESDLYDRYMPSNGTEQKSSNNKI